MKQKIKIPLTVPKNKEKEYIKNFNTATRKSGNMMLFAGDQKVEHLNNDFVGKKIPAEVADPEHYFKIANEAKIGCFATQIGLISKYARDYPKIPYIVKLNSKTNLLEEKYQDPFSNRWLPIEMIINFKKQSKLNIIGVGYTVYIGSKFESSMFGQAARIVHKAHKAGLLCVIWMYPKGVAINNKKEQEDIHLFAGGAGIALALGADFVKTKYPNNLKNRKKIAENFKEVTTASGRTGVLCSGGSKRGTKQFLQTLHDQIHISKVRGNATARNIYQRKLDEAIRMANAISSISMYNYSVDDAYKIFKGELELK